MMKDGGCRKLKEDTVKGLVVVSCHIIYLRIEMTDWPA